MKGPKTALLSLITCLALGACLAACHMFLDGHWGHEGDACDNNLQCSGDRICVGGWCRDYDEALECDNNQDCHDIFGPEDGFCNDAWMCDYRPVREFWEDPCSGENQDFCTLEGFDLCATFPSLGQDANASHFCTFSCLNPYHCPPETACSWIESGFVCAPTEFTAEMGIMCNQVQDCPILTGSDTESACLKLSAIGSSYGICSKTCSSDDQTSCPDGYTCCDLTGEVNSYCIPGTQCI